MQSCNDLERTVAGRSTFEVRRLRSFQLLTASFQVNQHLNTTVPLLNTIVPPLNDIVPPLNDIVLPPLKGIILGRIVVSHFSDIVPGHSTFE